MSSLARLQRWSYSVWAGMKQCPRKIRYAKIDKLPELPSPAAERGNTIHLKAEHYVKGDITGGVPRELKKLESEFRQLKKAKPEHVEEFWGFDKNWKPLRDGFDPKQTFTLKADAALAPRKGVAIGIDYKSGRVYDGHDDQAELTAVATHLWYPNAKEIEIEFWYIDKGRIVTYHFEVTYLEQRLKYWDKEGKKLLAEEKFIPTPSEDACKWCSFRSDKGGPCSAWKTLKNVD